jgi:hypothetical protein
MLNGSGGVSYSWSPATGLSCVSCPNPMASPASTTVYYLTVTDSAGCTNTDSTTVTVDMCTGIAGTSEKNKIQIFPNPFSSKTFVQMNGISPDKIKVKLFDITGKEAKPVISIKDKGVEIEKGELNPGLYFVQIYEGTRNITTLKLILQ